MLKREYIKFYSQYLQTDMELLIFGDRGHPAIFFPTRTARFYDYEDWKVIDAIGYKIDAGQVQMICVDSVDKLSFYNKSISPAERIQKHALYEKYILFEVIPFIKQKNSNFSFYSLGCSLGAYHALNIAFRYPQYFSKVIAMSGRYDLTLQLQYFDDLFDGYLNHEIECHMPSLYLGHMNSDYATAQLNKLDTTIVIGKADAFLQNNQQLHQLLNTKGVKHNYFEWEDEAHKPYYWRDMLRLYL